MVEQKRAADGAMEARLTPSELLERIHHFEHVYEIASKHMAKAVSLGVVRETAEIREWMRVYRRRLDVGDDYEGEKVIIPCSAPGPERTAGNEQTGNRSRIPVRRVSSQQMYDEMSASVREFENRYEMGSADMLELLSNDVVKETGDILKWMFDYRVLLGLEQEGTPTTGTLGTTF